MNILSRVGDSIAECLRIVRDADSTEGGIQRAVVVSCTGVVLCFSAFFAMHHHSVYKYITIVCAGMPSVVLPWHVLRTRAVPPVAWEFAMYSWGLAVLCVTYVTMKRGFAGRQFFLVLMLDLCLVNRLPTRVSVTILVVFSVCFMGLRLLTHGGGGLPDVVEIEHLCDCDSPPCRINLVTNSIVTLQDVALLALDFYFTRGFARRVSVEKASMQSTIDAVQRIAQHLSEYDVDSVAEILDEREGDMPAEMAAALRAVEENLRQYRPYLPDALFQDRHSQETQRRGSATNLLPPGMQTHEVTIVFTDIRASTSIWEAASGAMKNAILVHNAVIRDVLDRSGGYEVKTVGDAFMAAFETAADGVNFGLRVHTALAEADWPAALLQVPICAARGTLWRGLTVRVGVNSGPVTPEHHFLTGRADYFGHTVNVASRLESVCTPGAVCLCADLWAHVQGACDVAVAGPATEVELKGVKAMMSVCCVWPLKLARRRYEPLTEGEVISTCCSVSNCSKSTIVSSAASLSVLMHPVDATIGVVHISMEGSVDKARHLSTALGAITLHLTRSTGTLVTVLGNSVAVGWNVSRRLNSHAESSLCFARGATESVQCRVGLASGSVEHGDIGSARQRFVTVVGPAVHASWALSEAACEHSKLCLFAWLHDTGIPANLLSRLEATSIPFKGLATLPESHGRESLSPGLWRQPSVFALCDR